jgi:ATP-binding cassette subfamily F protein uup
MKESGELERLPERIDALERERERIYGSLADPALLRDGEAAAAAKVKIASIAAELEKLTRRWEELETVATAG